MSLGGQRSVITNLEGGSIIFLICPKGYSAQLLVPEDIYNLSWGITVINYKSGGSNQHIIIFPAGEISNVLGVLSCKMIMSLGGQRSVITNLEGGSIIFLICPKGYSAQLLVPEDIYNLSWGITVINYKSGGSNQHIIIFPAGEISNVLGVLSCKMIMSLGGQRSVITNLEGGSIIFLICPKGYSAQLLVPEDIYNLSWGITVINYKSGGSNQHIIIFPEEYKGSNILVLRG